MKLFFGFIILILAFTSCKKGGCTDYDALNYDPEAKVDDNSCYYFWIGQNYQGGKIFYIDRSRKHGLIAAPVSFQTIQWGCQNQFLNQENGDIVGKGSSNTLGITDACGFQTAAGLCSQLDTLGYDDWFLPSKEEVVGMVVNLYPLRELTDGGDESYLWSSSQVDTNTVYAVHPWNGAAVIFNKGQAYSVRPIRAF